MRCRVPLLLCGLLVAALVFGAVPAGAQPSAEETRLELQLQDDGDGRWTIVATVPLDDREDVENFRSFAEAYEQGDQDFRLGVDAFRRAASEASRTTGREMTVGSANRSAELVNGTTDNGTVDRYGELQVSFTWESFARIDENGTMYVGDAFKTTNGTWLSGIGPNQTLVIRSPPGYTAPTTSPIGAEDGDLRWEGPQTFEPGYFEIVYQPDPAGPGDGLGASTLLLIGALVLSGAALLLGLYLLWRRRDGTTSDEEPPAAANPGPDATAAPDEEAKPDDPDEAEPDDEPDLELLSDEERVEYLLEQNGGRMKQANIVKETGWSNAKVSQLLSSMEEADRIDKLRIGRENLISFPDEGVTDLESGSEDA
ncbi:helix-turn-helix transcriptional regulator [Natronomonas marina]|jgi:hypothetical protein|uniref:helix-turn-helix transcriptional regulator n=1 Tax=Natronomonas marina TaxID=2961939 RepID=UPI0020C93ED3|nr:hypothetical protein [Natronomonas marina]